MTCETCGAGLPANHRHTQFPECITHLKSKVEKLERDLKRAREKKRFEASVAAMVGMLPNYRQERSQSGDAAIAALSVRMADELLAQLAKDKEAG